MRKKQITELSKDLFESITKERGVGELKIIKYTRQPAQENEDQEYFLTTIRQVWTIAPGQSLVTHSPPINGRVVSSIEQRKTVLVFPVITFASDGRTSQCAIRFMDGLCNAYPPPVFAVVNTGKIKKSEDSRILIPFCEYRERYTPTFRMLREKEKSKLVEIRNLFHEHFSRLIMSNAYTDTYVDLDDASSEEIFPVPFVGLSKEKNFHIKYLV